MSEMRTSRVISDWLNYITHSEIDLIKTVVKSLPDIPMVVNIGAGAGTSGLAIMEAREDILLATIDITLESSPFGCLVAETDELTKAGILPIPEGDIRGYRQYHGDSKEVGEYWEHGKVDFVFVDGDHSEEGAFGDIEIWLKNIKVGGVIAVHDYKKVDAWLKREGVFHGDLTEDMLNKIKPWYFVDEAVDKLLVPFHKEIGRADAMIAFEVLSAEDSKVHNGRYKFQKELKAVENV